MESWINQIIGAMLLTCILMMSSCNDDGQHIEIADNRTFPDNVPETIYNDFQQDFPEATEVSWIVDNEYAIASFTIAESQSTLIGIHLLWYELKNAQKKMQSHTISFYDLPEAVKIAFSDSEYAEWKTKVTAEILTRYTTGTVESIYIVRATDTNENTGVREVTLYYTSTGVLVKMSINVIYDETYRDWESEYRVWLPQTPPDYVSNFVNNCYPQASYIYISVRNNITKLKILDGRQARLLLFDTSGNWLSTHTQLHPNELPEAVITAFYSSVYTDNQIENATEYLTSDNEHYFLLTIKDYSDKKLEIRINANGIITDIGNSGDNDDDGKMDDGIIYLSKTDVDASILQRYPNATVTDKKYDDNSLEIQLFYNEGKIKIQFELHPQGYVWIKSEWDLDIRLTSAIPTSILNTIETSYVNYQIYFLKYIEEASGGNYYEIGMKSTLLRQDIKVKLDEHGNILAEYGKC